MGLSIIKPDININFLGARRLFFIISLALVAVGLVSLIARGGPRYGIDFSGGIMAQLKFAQPMEADALRTALEKTGLADLTVQRMGVVGQNTEYMVRLSMDISSTELRGRLNDGLNAALPGNAFEIQRIESVGAKVSADLKSQALEAMFYAVLLIAIYISGRFEHRWVTAAIMGAALGIVTYILSWLGVPTAWLILAATALTVLLCWKLKLNYALGAVIGLIHDAFITIGIFVLLGKEIDLTFVAAILAVIGYSLNDTIIIYDRVRENLRQQQDELPLQALLNRSVNQTLSRTILTVLTTMLAVLALYIFGGGIINNFALALIIGIIIGTYSSIFVSCPILLIFTPLRESKA